MQLESVENEKTKLSIKKELQERARGRGAVVLRRTASSITTVPERDFVGEESAETISELPAGR